MEISKKIYEEKKALRKRYLSMRKSLSRDEVERKSLKVIENIKKTIPIGARTFLFYVPINNEVDLLPLARDLFLKRKTILFPRLINYRDIVPYVIEDLFFDFKPGAYNIPEPDTRPFLSSIDVAFIPGIVFGKDGHRIGYGKRYFDMFLFRTNILKTMGICFDFQIVDKIPHTEEDFPLNTVISEKKILNIAR